MKLNRAELTPKQRLIFPLDVPDWKSAEPLVHKLKDQVGFFKVGLELFTAEGPRAVRKLTDITQGRIGLFLDLKLHDIPATVGRAAAAAERLGADLLTVHASGGPAMIEAARKAAGRTKILAVTVLTSLDPSGLTELKDEYRRPGALVLRLARQAAEAGGDGFVCSGHESAALRSEFGPDQLIIVPGIRPAWSLVEGDDQQRVVTPRKAIAAGADLLVVGRPIRDAADPAQAAVRVVQEIDFATPIAPLEI
ncbi:MAG: orotidine-5'-phosphate decarboxylase [Thermodesulfobacteriota bacterium]